VTRPRAEWCLAAPLARHPFASHGSNIGRASRLMHSAPSSSQVSVDHRAPGGRSGYPEALEGATGWKKGARHPPTSLRLNSSVVELRHLSRAQEQQPVRVAVSVSALTASARDLAGDLPSGMQPGVSGCSSANVHGWTTCASAGPSACQIDGLAVLTGAWRTVPLPFAPSVASSLPSSKQGHPLAPRP
jgi:hypothetical protein